MRQAPVNILVLFSVMLLVACEPLSRKPILTTPSPTSESSPVPSPPPSATLPTQIDRASSWIEIDLAEQTIALHEEKRVIAEYPASSGVASDPKYATPPGLYRVQSKEKGPLESVPGVFVSDIIMFDIQNGNGIHSRPMDAEGNVLDATLGQPSTAGCVRVGESASVFEFARLGMWVWIH